jgi:RNA polymerase sigma-70 factor (ECF subfamily)
MHSDLINKLQYRLAEGDETALKELHRLFCNPLFQWAMTIVRSRHMAEEIVEDTFIKIWEQRLQIPHISNLKSYLYTVTRNISLDYLRKTAGKKSYSLEEADLPPLVINSTPEDMMISAEIIKRVNLAINDLPPKCRLIFKLVKVDGLKYKEVANLLDINIKTVESQMRIALKRLHTSIMIYLPSYIR